LDADRGLGVRSTGSPRARAGELSDPDDGSLAFLQATNRLFTFADPGGAKRLIDRMSWTTARQGGIAYMLF
jgi:hypothetical protein